MRSAKRVAAGRIVAAAVAGFCGAVASSAGAAEPPGYVPRILVANDPAYHPDIVDPYLQDAWGIALRPPGAGGHFWISNTGSGTTTTYVGDVNGRPLTQDALKVVDIPAPTTPGLEGRPKVAVSQPIGQVYNASPTDFVVSGEGITGASKFIFSTAEGTIAGWTETPDPLPGDPGHVRRQTKAVLMVDHSDQYENEILRYTGLAVTTNPANNRLYATNFATQAVETFDHQFKPVALGAGAFRYPGMPDDYTPWNVQYFRKDQSDPGSLFVAYVPKDDPWEELAGPGAGTIAEFDLDGRLIRKFDQRSAQGELNDPWGFAVAPKDFGPLSGALLVSNFGDGTIVGYDLKTGKFIDYLRGIDGEPISIDGLWGLTFGNGVALGDANALYFTAGPNNELDGLFGSIRYADVPEPTAAAVLLPLAGAATLRRRRR